MQVSVETTSSLERRMTVGVPSQIVEADVQKKLQEMARSARINGFRPGKVPVREIKRRYGKEIRQEVISAVISKTFYEAVQKEELKPAGMPNIESTKDESGQEFEYVATFEVYPEVEVVKPSGASVSKPLAEVGEEDIEKVLENIRQQNKSWQGVERAAQEGDQVNIDYVGTKDGEEFEGGKADGTALELGSNTMIPGFEDGLVGANAGEEVILDLTFPEQYQAEELAGQAVQFKVKVNEVQEAVLPELDEEFIRKFNIEDNSVDGLKAEIRKNLEKELEQAVQNKVKTQAIDHLLDANEIDLPNTLIQQEIQRMQQQMFGQFGGGQNFDPSLLPQDMFKEQAERSVKLALLASEIIKTEEIKADADRVRTMIEDMAKNYEQPEQVVNWYYSNEEKLAEIESAVLEEQVVDSILSGLEVNEVESSYEEVMRPPQAEEAESE